MYGVGLCGSFRRILANGGLDFLLQKPHKAPNHTVPTPTTSPLLAQVRPRKPSLYCIPCTQNKIHSQHHAITLPFRPNRKIQYAFRHCFNIIDPLSPIWLATAPCTKVRLIVAETLIKWSMRSAYIHYLTSPHRYMNPKLTSTTGTRRISSGSHPPTHA